MIVLTVSISLFFVLPPPLFFLFFFSCSYIGATVDHHFDVDHITGEMFQVRYHFGEVYVGPMLNGKRHGWGMCTYTHGGEYIGQWFHDRRHGTEDNIFIFLFLISILFSHPLFISCSVLTGFGRCVTRDEALGGGVLYEGPWRHDKQHGFGRTRFPDGSSHEGEYAYGLWHGIGTSFFFLFFLPSCFSCCFC